MRVKCVLSLNHGNSASERGCSINKIMLEAPGYFMQESTVEALHLVKEEMLRIGGVMKFNINTDLILEVNKASIWEIHS